MLLANGTGIIEVDSNIDMNSNKIVNVTDPNKSQDVPPKAYVDAQLSATDLTISTAGDSGSGSDQLQTLTVAGTSNEIETSANPDNYSRFIRVSTVINGLTVPTAIIDEVTILETI